jgi:hypothetical protein
VATEAASGRKWPRADNSAIYDFACIAQQEAFTLGCDHSNLAVGPMFRSSRRILASVVLIAGFPSLAFAQRTQSILPAGPRQSVSTTTSATAFSSRAASAVSMKGFSSASIFPSLRAANATSTNSNQEHRFALSTEEDQHQIIPLQVTATPFATESRVPIAPLLGARLQLNFSTLNIRNGNVMLGPTPASEILHAPAQARSAELYGLGVSIPLGRGPRAQTSENLLRSAMRIVRGN